MAILTNAQVDTLATDIQREVSAARDVFAGLTKADLRAVIVAVDGWVDANQASYNNALPAAAKAGLTLKQKVRLLLAVIRRRYEVQ